MQHSFRCETSELQRLKKVVFLYMTEVVASLTASAVFNHPQQHRTRQYLEGVF
jgi:ABC-type phosphate transport system ATPase subunit